MASLPIWFFWALFVASTLELEKYGISGCMVEERNALLKLKQAINASALSSWREREDCCSWENVKCDFNFKRVVQLYLNRTIKLSSSTTQEEEGYLDLSLFSPFQELKNLSLNGSFLRGFTGELRSSKLQYLDLSSNWLIESPPSLGRQKSLKHLNPESNCLTNLSDFEDLITLSALELLNLGYNDISGDIPPSIGALTSLKALSFRNNELTGSLPGKGLCMLRNLELDLSRNSLTGVIPSCLGNLTSLKLLELSENSLVGNIPLFTDLKSLEYVKLDSHNNKLVVDTENQF